MSSGGHRFEVPDKLHFKASEVCELTETQPYILKFWEQEFPQLAPEKNRTGQKLYRKRDVELIQRIKHLLYEKDYTIAGVRRLLEAGGEDEDILREERAALQLPPDASSSSTFDSTTIPERELNQEEGRQQSSHRGDLRQDLSGLLFEQPQELPPGAPGNAGTSVEAITSSRREALAAAEREALASAEIARLRDQRDQFAAEVASLWRRLEKARAEIRQLLAELGSPAGSDAAQS